MLDPDCDVARRVWLSCTPCGSTDGLYLLASEGRYVFVQCGNCEARYWLDTHVGKGRPDHVNDTPAWMP